MGKVALTFFHLTFGVKSLSVTIQMKGVEQVFPIELFIVLCKVVLTFKSDSEILTFQMKATERWYSVYLFMLRVFWPKQLQAM